MSHGFKAELLNLGRGIQHLADVVGVNMPANFRLQPQEVSFDLLRHELATLLKELFIVLGTHLEDV